MKSLNIAENTAITVSSERLRSDLGILPEAVDYLAVERAVQRGRANQAAAVGRVVARVAGFLTRPHQVPAEGIERAVYLARHRDAAVLRSMVAARARREDALQAAIHRARSRDASILRRALRRVLTAGEAPAVGPARRVDGDGFGVMIGGMAVTLVEAANNNDRRQAA